MIRHPTWAVGSQRSDPLAAGTPQTEVAVTYVMVTTCFGTCFSGRGLTLTISGTGTDMESNRVTRERERHV